MQYFINIYIYNIVYIICILPKKSTFKMVEIDQYPIFLARETCPGGIFLIILLVNIVLL